MASHEPLDQRGLAKVVRESVLVPVHALQGLADSGGVPGGIQLACCPGRTAGSQISKL